MRNRQRGELLQSPAKTDLSASATALSSLSSRQPQPSKITKTTGRRSTFGPLTLDVSPAWASVRCRLRIAHSLQLTRNGQRSVNERYRGRQARIGGVRTEVTLLERRHRGLPRTDGAGIGSPAAHVDQLAGSWIRSSTSEGKNTVFPSSNVT